MAKTKRLMLESISLVDIVIELLDARIPISSQNPEIDNLTKNKLRVVILNKSDLSDERYNVKWKAHFESQGIKVIFVNSIKGVGISEIETVCRELMKEKIERLRARGRIFVPIRAMICGIPNVGKSTLINKYVGKAMTKTGDRPGVTRSNQWVKIRKDFELLDTPGILWPKFEDQDVGLNLAFCGAIKDDIMDMYSLSLKLIEKLQALYPEALKNRYKIEVFEEDSLEKILEKIAEARGFKMKGNELDLDRASIILIDEFRAAKLGKITLEHV